ncbi:MAG: hypothetical protein ACK2UK_22795, partial [Candidatus Promineifilaceae bacterium]
MSGTIHSIIDEEQGIGIVWDPDFFSGKEFIGNATQSADAWWRFLFSSISTPAYASSACVSATRYRPALHQIRPTPAA